MKAKQVKTALELIKTYREGIIPLWNGEQPLFRILESEEIKKLSNREKYALKAAYYQTFQKEISTLKVNITASNLEDLLNSIAERELNPQKLEYVVNSNSKEELFELLQNFIYLGIYPSIYTKKELALRKFVEKIKRNLEPIKEGLDKAKKEFSKFETSSPILEERKREILKLLDQIDKAIDTLGNNEPIKVAVFATKKSGKSMVVNALLEEEFAPTSLELPTPTVVEYYPWDERYIRVEIDKNLHDFEKPEEVKSFLNKFFKKDDLDLKGGKIPVVKVFYPRKEDINYIIFDTPGPDLAGSKHGDFIEDYINKSEVAIFIVDYSKYAQDSEIELLEKVVEGFKKRGKEDTLIIAVNKLDLMYQDEDTEKVKIRVADFIRNKLQKLGIEKPIVVPITALIYFYAKKLEKVFPEIRDTHNLRMFFLEKEEELIEGEKNFQISDEVLQTISNFVGYLRAVQKIRKPKYDDLINATGFEGLKKYITYIGVKKAFLERYIFALNKIVSAYSELKNKIELNKKLINEDTDKLEKILSEFEEKLSKGEIEEEYKKLYLLADRLKYTILNSLDRVLSKELEYHFDRITGELEERIDRTRQEVYNIIKDIPCYTDNRSDVEAKVKGIQELLKELKRTYSETLKEDFLKEKVFEIIQSLLIEVFKALHKKTKKIEEELKNSTELVKNDLKQTIVDLKTILKKEFNIDLEFKIPNPEIVPILEFLIEEYKNLKFYVDMLNIKIDIKDSDIVLVYERDFLDKLFSFNWKDYEVYMNEELINDFLNDIRKSLAKNKNNIKETLRNFSKETLETFKKFTGEVFFKFFEDLRSWKESIIRPIEELKENIQQEKEIRLQILKMYENFEEILNRHTNLIEETIKEFEQIKSS